MITSNLVESVRTKFNFTVDKFPLSGPDNMPTPHYGLFRSDNRECVGRAVSKRYVPHTTEDVVALVEAASAAFDENVRLTMHWNKGHHILIEPTNEHRYAVYGQKDNTFPRMGIDFGYDGDAASGFLGLFRDNCRNLMRLQQTEGTRVSIMHTESLRTKMDDLIDVFRGLKDGWKSITETIAQMENRQVSLVDFLDALYPRPAADSGRGVTMHKNMITEIFNRAQSEIYSTGRPTMLRGEWKTSAWVAFNAVQGYVQHDKRAKKGEFDQILLAMADPIVRKAEVLALTMA